MTDDDNGRGTVVSLPLVRLFPPPEATPPDSLGPDADTAGGFPALPPALPAVPPESLRLPGVLTPGEDDTAGAALVNSVTIPGDRPARNAAATAMVLAAGIAVAALNGCFSVVEYIKARAEHHRAVKAKAGDGKADKGGQSSTPRVPAGPEFGKAAVKNRHPKLPTGPRGRAAGPGGTPGRAPGRTFRTGGADAPKRVPERALRGSKGAKRGPRPERDTQARRDAAGREKRRRDKPSGPTPRKDTKTPAGAGAITPKSPKPPKGSKGPRPQKQKKGSLVPAGGDAKKRRQQRRTLPKALGDEAARRANERLKKRRKNPGPPLLGPNKPQAPKKTPDGKVDLAKALTKGGSMSGSGKSGKASRTHTPGGTPGERPWKVRQSKTTTGPKPKKQRQQKKRRRWGRHTRNDRPWENQDTIRDTPDPSGEWLKPPPGWTVTYSVTIERVRPHRHARPQPPAPRPAVTTGQRALPRAPENGVGPRPGTTAPSTQAAPGAAPARPAGGTVTTAPVVRTTQYADSDLTIYDVIDADADMAEEILAGADHARAAAGKCEEMTDRLESLRAEILRLKVPGVLAGMVALLIEKSAEVRNRANAVATTLPRASEAIKTAGENASRRHRPLADAVKDAGHRAPAEREYHTE